MVTSPYDKDTPPQGEGVLQSYERVPGYSWADRSTAALTTSWFHLVCICLTRVATPAAWGDAIDVPLR